MYTLRKIYIHLPPNVWLLDIDIEENLRYISLRFQFQGLWPIDIDVLYQYQAWYSSEISENKHLEGWPSIEGRQEVPDNTLQI
jgi:hypothetical protein